MTGGVRILRPVRAFEDLSLSGKDLSRSEDDPVSPDDCHLLLPGLLPRICPAPGEYMIPVQKSRSPRRLACKWGKGFDARSDMSMKWGKGPYGMRISAGLWEREARNNP